MATRVSGRAARAASPIALPTLPRPQAVDAAGFELSDEDLAVLAGEVARVDTAEMEVEEEEVEEAEEEEEAEDEEEEADEEADEEAEEEAEADEEADEEQAEEEVEEAEAMEVDMPAKTPLLGLAER